MYDRVIRADLYQSDRWLDLPTDTHRLVFNALVHEADDFGNLDGGARRLFRFMQRFCQVKTQADAMKVMSDLADADLVRRYEVNGLEYWHLPRFKNTRRYTSRKYPCSPWCDGGQMSSAEKLRQQNKAHKSEPAADLPQTSSRPAADVLRGEERGRSGVGEERGRSGVGEERGKSFDQSTVSGTPAPSAAALDAAASPRCVEKIPLNNGTEFEVTAQFAAELGRLYPAVDVSQTLREIRGYNLAHRVKRKTRAGVEAHITRWFQKEQDRAS